LGSVAIGSKSLLEGDVEDADSITLILLKGEKREPPYLYSPMQVSPTHGEVSSEPQPLLLRHQPAPKIQWVMVVAPKDPGSGWRGVMRLLRK
jgi:hypothetical protein